MATGKKTGGRASGTPNKATAAKAAEVAASGLTPLDYMLSIMRDENKMPDIRLDAAKSAAPYVHPKPAQQVIHAGDEEGGPIDLNHSGEIGLSGTAAFIAETLGMGADAASKEPGED